MRFSGISSCIGTKCDIEMMNGSFSLGSVGSSSWASWFRRGSVRRVKKLSVSISGHKEVLVGLAPYNAYVSVLSSIRCGRARPLASRHESCATSEESLGSFIIANSSASASEPVSSAGPHLHRLKSAHMARNPAPCSCVSLSSSSGSLSQLAWYHESSGTTSTSCRPSGETIHAGCVRTPTEAQTSLTRRNWSKELMCSDTSRGNHMSWLPGVKKTWSKRSLSSCRASRSTASELLTSPAQRQTS
mmetsp:Transcript_12729/g.28707  ORF Transcript_12729/g.28707 Transcript_12729/m.28707 type:complete len:245 (-) Transcript_12729:482-1216(-)